MKKYTIFVVINSLLTDIIFELIRDPRQSNNDGSTCPMSIDDVEMVGGHPSKVGDIAIVIIDCHFKEKSKGSLLYVQIMGYRWNNQLNQALPIWGVIMYNTLV